MEKRYEFSVFDRTNKELLDVHVRYYFAMLRGGIRGLLKCGLSESHASCEECAHQLEPYYDHYRHQ